MINPSERFAHLKELAAQREGDIRIKELTSAITIDIDDEARPDAAYGGRVHVQCHNRGWGLYMMGRHIGELQKLDDDALAAEVAGWIQGAIESRFLTLSHPPRGWAPLRARRSLGWYWLRQQSKPLPSRSQHGLMLC